MKSTVLLNYMLGIKERQPSIKFQYVQKYWTSWNGTKGEQNIKKEGKVNDRREFIRKRDSW